MKKERKPNNYWTYDRCKEEALKYGDLKTFTKMSETAVKKARELNILYEICEHMSLKKQHPLKYWTIDICRNIALRFETKSEFAKNEKNVYEICRKNNWISEVTKHMLESKHGSYSKLTFEEIKKIALQYSSKTDFHNGHNRVYKISKKEKYYDEICSHMIKPIPKIYWTKEKCLQESLLFSSRFDMQKGSGSAYDAILRNGWRDEAFSHMKEQGHRLKRIIYSYEFKSETSDEKYVYVGLTYNIVKRDMDHNKNGTVYNFILKSGMKPIIVIHTELVDAIEAQKLEGLILEKYKLEGWVALNISKTGGLGGSEKWSYDFCLKLSQLCNDKKSFRKLYEKVYYKANRKGWLIDFFPNEIKEKMLKWDYELCKEKAKECKTRSEFWNRYYQGASLSKKLGVLDEFFPETIAKEVGYWDDKQNCFEESKKYKTRTEYARKCMVSYLKSQKNGWLDEFFPDSLINLNGYWENKENITKEIEKFQTLAEFRKYKKYGYTICKKQNWLNDFFNPDGTKK